MKRMVVCVLAVSLFVQGVFSQDAAERLRFFRTSFDAANLDVKLQLIEEAAESPDAELGPFYQDVVRFVVDNSARLNLDTQLQAMAREAITAIVAVDYDAAARTIWDLFESYDETTSRVQILQAMSILGQDNADVVTLVNRWVSNGNSLRRGGGRPDLQVMEAAIRTLGELGNDRAFAAILDARLLQYSAAISATAVEAMESLNTPVFDLMVRELEQSNLSRKREIFDLVRASEILDDDQVVRFAVETIRDALNATPASLAEENALRALRIEAARAVLGNETEDMTRTLVDHFNRTYLEFDRGQVTRSALLEAIALLGGTGSQDAARRLGRYLELLNSYTENDRPYDTQVVLAVLDNLRRLGFRTVYNTVFYVTLLDQYPSRVIQAARATLDALER